MSEKFWNQKNDSIKTFLQKKSNHNNNILSFFKRKNKHNLNYSIQFNDHKQHKKVSTLNAYLFKWTSTQNASMKVGIQNKASGIFMYLILLFLKALFPIDFNFELGEKLTYWRLMQLSNASSHIFSTLDGIVMLEYI